MILKLIDLQEMIDWFFDPAWVAIWPLDDL